ncbi:MAG: molybdopterin-binding protein [Chloroflexota bacterium]|jgi:competence/damage-inducible protein CinA-like protein
MPTAEIIAIGTELLLGEMQDTNTAHLARTLRDYGVDIYRATLVGDNAARIASMIQEALSRAQIIITTGGLGPTVDDPTREAVSLAVDKALVFHPELWVQIQERYHRYQRLPTENNRRQAFLPVDAVAIPNPDGTAPAFYFDTGSAVIICLPGVPREMETILQQSVLPFLCQRFNLKETIFLHVLHAAGVGESQVDEWIGDLETLSNPTVGLLAHPGQTDIRITAKAASVSEARRLTDTIANEIRQRMGEHIYGENNQTLEGVVAQRLIQLGYHLAIFTSGFTEGLETILAQAGFPVERLFCTSGEFSSAELLERANQTTLPPASSIVLAAGYYPGADQLNLFIHLHTPHGSHESNRSFGGPPSLGMSWAIRTTLDFVRRKIN